MKKILAVLLSIALVCGVCMTSFAAGAVKKQAPAKAGQAEKEELTEKQYDEVIDAAFNDLIQYELEDEEETNGVGPKLLEAFREAYENGKLSNKDIQAFLFALAVITYFDDDEFEDYETVHFLAELLDNKLDTKTLEECLAVIEKKADEYDEAGYDHVSDPTALIAYILESSDDKDGALLDEAEIEKIVGYLIALGVADDDDYNDFELLDLDDETTEEAAEDKAGGLAALLASAFSAEKEEAAKDGKAGEEKAGNLASFLASAFSAEDGEGALENIIGLLLQAE